MKTLLSFLFVLTVFCPYAQPLAILNARVVDVKQGRLMEGSKDILIINDRIARVAPAGSLPVEDITFIDATGHYIIPGLWDMHTHPDDPEVWWMKPIPAHRDQLMPLFVLYGVTGTRDMAGSLEVVNDWRRRIRQGALLGPEIIAAGPLLDGPNAMWDGSVSIADARRVKPVVDSLIEEGIDFLKVYSGLPREVFFALMEYANKIGFPVVGHIPTEVTTAEGARTGMACQEHLLDILTDCSREGERIRRGEVEFEQAKDGLQRYFLRNKLIMDTYDEKKAEALFREFARHNTWHTPTLSMWYKNAYYEEEAVKDSAYWKYLPPYLKEYWGPETNVHLKYRQPEVLATKRRQLEFYLRITGEMHRAGVKLLAGTDTGANPLCWPGIGLHNELELLVHAGLSPAEALKTATINPAEFLGLTSDFGTVTPGKVADLVILNGNPLEDIRAVRDIEAVVRRGKLYDNKAREAILVEISTTN